METQFYKQDPEIKNTQKEKRRKKKDDDDDDWSKEKE